MSQPYICKKCGKEMWSFNDVVEYWDDIYCKWCNPNAQINKQQGITNEKIKPQKKEEVDVKSIEEISPAIYKKGDFIGQKYEVFGVLGEGGFGIVYLVYSKTNEEAYALKTLRNEYIEDMHTRDRFKKEAQIWINLERHPYIVQAYFVEEIANRLFIKMEYIAPNDYGLKSLEGYLKYQPPDLTQSLRWAIQFCYGMEYAYSKGIKAHRDIKPANIMIGQDKAVKISDFGLAGVIGESKAASGIKIDIRQGSVGFSCQTMEGVGFGTPTHMPPEQFINAAGCDERSDIYSFGVVLYQMATGGELPFLTPFPQNDSYEESRRFWIEMYKLHSQAPVPKLSTPLFPIIFRCLEKKPINRYFSFKEIRRDLETLLIKQKVEVIALPQKEELEEWELFNKGLSLGNLDKYREEIDCYDRILSLNLTFSKAWWAKGFALVKLGEYQAAINCYDKALIINPQDINTLFSKGFALGELGRHKDAIACYDKILEIDVNDTSAFNSKGHALEKLGKPHEALACYDKVLEISPTDVSAWCYKGLLLDNLNKYHEAIDCYDKAIELNPMDTMAWLFKGLTLERRGYPFEAIDCYNQILKINSKDASTWYNKAVLEDNCGRKQDAALSYKRFIELAPADPSKQIEKARKRLRELEEMK